MTNCKRKVHRGIGGIENLNDFNRGNPKIIGHNIQGATGTALWYNGGMLEEQRTCAYCNKKFTVLGNKKKYCSNKCCLKANRRRQVCVQTCVHCGEQFEASYRGKKYCNKKSCKSAKRIVRTFACKYCGIEFRTHRAKQDYCSNDCAHKSRIIKRVCSYCGKTFTGRYSKYCSNECSEKSKNMGFENWKKKQNIHCSQCGKKVEIRKYHYRRRNQRKNFLCSECNKNPRWCICKICGKKFLYKKNLIMHSIPVCSVKCRNVAVPKKPVERNREYAKTASKKKRIKTILDHIGSGLLRQSKRGLLIAKPHYPKWCVACGKTVYVPVSEMYKRNVLLCKECAPLGQKRLCFCGQPRRIGNGKHKTKTRYCEKHYRFENRMGDLYRPRKDGRPMNKEQIKKLSKKEIVAEIIAKVHKVIKKWKNAEAEITVGIMELEKLNAHKHVSGYNTFLELVEAEFGWTEMKYSSAKRCVEMFGVQYMKEYGREALVCISRLPEEKREKVFTRIQEYKTKKSGKQPSYTLVNNWVNKESSTVKERGASTKLVDIKKRYVQLLEENNELRKTVARQTEEIARLNLLLKKHLKNVNFAKLG